MFPERKRYRERNRKMADLTEAVARFEAIDGEEFAANVATMKDGMWREARNRHGKPYDSFASFCEDSKPFGLGCPVEKLEEIVRVYLARGKKKVRRLLSGKV